jgi:ParB family chromosome partitioning protein
MAKNSIDAYGASGKTNVLMFEPENLHLVTDKTHPLYDERIHLPISEAMVLNIMDQGVLEPIIVWKDPKAGWPVWWMVVSACAIPWRLISVWLNRVNLHYWFLRSLNAVQPFAWRRRW